MAGDSLPICVDRRAFALAHGDTNRDDVSKVGSTRERAINRTTTTYYALSHLGFGGKRGDSSKDLHSSGCMWVFF